MLWSVRALAAGTAVAVLLCADQVEAGFQTAPIPQRLANLTNPIFQKDTWSTKDASMVYLPQSKQFLVAFSAFSTDTGPGKPSPTTISHVAGMLTTDFIDYTELFWITGHDEGWTGMCSPNFTPMNETFWIMTFNSWGDESNKPNQLFYLTSADIDSWVAQGGRAGASDPKYYPLGETVTSGVRAIDAAVKPVQLANGTSRWLLAYKRVQTPFFALAPMSGPGQPGAAGLEGQFVPVPSLSFTRRDGKLDMADHENWDFFEGPDGKMRLVSSDYGLTVTGPRTSWLYTQAAAGDFSRWQDGYPINVTQSWYNNDDLANAGFVADWRKVSGIGQYVLIFAGNTQKSSGSFAGRGHNRLGFAVSADLGAWTTLPSSPAPPTAA